MKYSSGPSFTASKIQSCEKLVYVRDNFVALMLNHSIRRLYESTFGIKLNYDRDPFCQVYLAEVS